MGTPSMAGFFHPNNGYVVYNHVTDGIAANYWTAVQNTGRNEVSAMSTPSTSSKNSAFITQTISALRAQAADERQKELALLKAAGLLDLGISLTDKDLIKKINILMNGKKQFEKALARIKSAQSTANKKGKNNKNKKVTSSEVFSLFYSVLASKLSRNLRKLVSSFSIDRPVRDFLNEVENVFNRAVENSAKDILLELQKHQDQLELYDSVKIYREIYEVYKIINNMNDEFKQMLKSKLNIDGFAKMLYRDMQSKGKEKVLKNFSTNYIRGDQGLRLNSVGYSIGGTVRDRILAFLGMVNFKAVVTEGGTTVSMSGTQKGGDLNVLTFNGLAALDSKKLAELFNQNMAGTENLTDIANNMENYYNKYLANLNDDFIIYTNADAWTSAFSNSNSFNGTYPIESAIGYMQRGGVGVSSNFLYLVYNAMSGAVGEGRQGEVKQAVENGVKAGVAAMLFDSWSAVGKVSSGAQSIHILSLGGSQVPLSVFLFGMANTLATVGSKISSYLTVDVSMSSVGGYSAAGGDASAVIAAWNAQRAEVVGKNKFTINFLSSFNRLVSTWI